MDDKAYVRLVDAHAEGDGSHDDVNLLHQEVVLCLRTQRRLKTGMVGGCLDIVGLQYFRQLLHLLARQTVDDAALAGVQLDEADDVLVDIDGLGTYLVIEVGTVERTLELVSVYDT